MTSPEPPPTLSRRRELGSGSANSLLLTVLGEFVLPGGRPVWTSSLLDALSRTGRRREGAAPGDHAHGRRRLDPSGTGSGAAPAGRSPRPGIACCPRARRASTPSTDRRRTGTASGCCCSSRCRRTIAHSGPGSGRSWGGPASGCFRKGCGCVRVRRSRRRSGACWPSSACRTPRTHSWRAPGSSVPMRRWCGRPGTSTRSSGATRSSSIRSRRCGRAPNSRP